MSTRAGTGKLVRLILRRERVRLSIWVAVLALIPVATANAFIGLYPTEASRESLTATVGSSPALTTLLGPLYDSSIGALTAWRFGTIGAFMVALMAILTMIRHTREEEETGRRELLGSTVVGRNAPLTAAMTVTIGAGVALGVLISIGLIVVGLPAAGSLAFGIGFTALAAASAAVGAVGAQLTAASSTARGIGVGIVGVAFVLRMAGDSSGEGVEWLSWLSPIGWFSRLRPFAGERWWVLSLWVGLAVILGTVAEAIASRRDMGAGAISPRPGPGHAPAGLGSPLGLAWRLHRGSVVAWTAGIAVLGAVYGGAAEGIGDMLQGNPQLLELVEQLGGEQRLVDAFVSAAVGILALVTSAYAIRAVLRLDVEEERVRAEPVLATATSRTRWAWSHVFFGILGPALILAVAGIVTGVTYGAMVGAIGSQVPGVLGAAMVQLPAVWILTGAAMALYGLAPRYAGLSWGLLVWCLVLGQLGQILQFPQWSLNLSPFSHIPLSPAEDIELVPMAWLLLLAVGLIGAGMTGFRKRDIR